MQASSRSKGIAFSPSGSLTAVSVYTLITRKFFLLSISLLEKDGRTEESASASLKTA